MKKLKLVSLSSTPDINIQMLQARFKKSESMIVEFDPKELKQLEELFTVCKVPYLTSPTEAESLCSYLALSGQVDAVISNDSDICAYGVKKFLYEINVFTKTCIEIDLAIMLAELKLTFESFRDWCIMCGTDYNNNIPGIGPVNAFKLIQKYKRIEDIPKDTDILNYVRTRELFSPLNDPKFTGIKCEVICGQPDEVEVHNFLIRQGSRIRNFETAFRGVQITFV
jgi:5'-3' exonuclease